MRQRLIYILKHSSFLQAVYRVVMSFVFRVIGLFIPVDDHLVIFVSFMGMGFNDSPKVIYDYQVEIPDLLESGRAAISKGCLKRAKKIAEKNVKRLFSLLPPPSTLNLVGIEPSCILSFRDEYPDLVPAELRSQAKELGCNSLLFDEFIVREVKAGHISTEDFKSDAVEIWLHGHCHQKALVGTEKTVAAFKLLQGAKIHVIPSGCCGMAGSFGYEKEHYKTSLAIGEMVLFPTIRKATEKANGVIPVIVSAPGTSCRQQIKDGTGVHAVHPIEILYHWVK